MAQGDGRHWTLLLRRGRRAALAATLAAGTLTTGCGESSTDEDLAPLPRYWQGSTSATGRDAWAAAGPIDLAAPEGVYGSPYAAAQPYQYAVPYDLAASLPGSAMGAAGARWSYPVTPQRSLFAAEPAHLPAVDQAPSFANPLAAPQDVPAADAGLAPGESRVVSTQPASSVAPIDSFNAPPASDVAVDESAPLRFPSEPTDTRDLPAQAAAPSVRNEFISPAPPMMAAGDRRPRMSPTPSGGAPTGLVVNQRATAKIRRGYELADRGAYFAAQREFVDVLRMIAEAKDQIHGAPRRTIALTAGLRALEEADDFAPLASGDAPLSVIVASHDTPAAKAYAVDELLPQQLADAYLQYAQVQLGAAVAGEPVGSMALHALGKLQSRLARIEADTNPLADRRAFALQQAALLARSDNHMAAHELGVLLAESGHYVESDQLLRQVAARAPHAVVFRNLARVERQLGRPDLAAASDQQAEYLAARGAGEPSAVQWVGAEALARTPDPLGPTTMPGQMAAAPSGQRPAMQSQQNFGPQGPAMARGPMGMQR